ncbi:hypothetical protein PMIN04_002857 [Paraphaeosphaeria minitans]
MANLESSHVLGVGRDDMPHFVTILLRLQPHLLRSGDVLPTVSPAADARLVAFLQHPKRHASDVSKVIFIPLVRFPTFPNHSASFGGSTDRSAGVVAATTQRFRGCTGQCVCAMRFDVFGMDGWESFGKRVWAASVGTRRLYTKRRWFRTSCCDTVLNRSVVKGARLCRACERMAFHEGNLDFPRWNPRVAHLFDVPMALDWQPLYLFRGTENPTQSRRRKADGKDGSLTKCRREASDAQSSRESDLCQPRYPCRIEANMTVDAHVLT